MRKKTSSTMGEGDHQPERSIPLPVSIEDACQLHERAVALREQGQHAEAARCARHALIAFERECGSDHPDVANILNNLAGICEDQGDYAEEACRFPPGPILTGMVNIRLKKVRMWSRSMAAGAV